MTGRVRFTPLLRAGVFAAGGLLAADGAAQATDVPFVTQPPISTTADNAESVFAADVDGDGDLDALSASYADDKVAWYENTAGNGTAWTLRTITTAANGAASVLAADIDGDGDLDAVSASLNDDKVAWYENTAGNGTAWALRTITTAADGADAVHAGDVDGDGDLDIIAASLFDGTVAWHENTAGNGTAWTTHPVMTGTTDPTFVSGADVDRDGDLDVLSCSGFAHALVWHENAAGNGSSWIAHTIFNTFFNGRSVRSADLDGDGDPDVVAGIEIPGLLWFENTAGNGTAWTAHIVDNTAASEDAYPADLDHDGDMDLVSASAGTVRWHENTGAGWITRTVTAAPGASGVVAADVDGDGDADLLSASYADDRIAWHRNDTIHESACFGTGAPMATGLGAPREVAAADVDGDADQDGLLVSFNFTQAAQVMWTENAAGDGSAWAPHTITAGNDLASMVVAADVDGDGDFDAVSIGYYSYLGWHRNDAGNGSAWTTLPIGTTGLSTATADIDGDGDMDALTTTNFFNPFVHWWENLAGNGSSWTIHTIATLMTNLWGPSYSVAAADIDGDGDVDVLTQNGDVTAPAFWFDNSAGDGSAWIQRTLPVVGPSILSPADVDGDGDEDVAVLAASLTWLENALGNGSSWITHTIAGSGGRSVFVADLDRDGDPDVLATEANGLAWHENSAGDGSAWLPHSLPAGNDSRWGVSAADFDGDGDLDVQSSSTNGGRVDWFRNGAGQFSLTGSDISPGSAMNGDLVPMLAITARHLGRVGDGDLELATLGLRFEEAPGDPLTSAEANALIENLHVYRDANGNGVFDPGVDVLVTTLPTLALAGGVQVVTLADGDPNLQVSLGTPRTYFVVTELTGNASGQTPNQFQVTHLGTGPSASTAEDRTYDIPLRPACPADVTASVGPITPVELLGFSVE